MRVRIPINGSQRIPKRKKLDRLEPAPPPPVFTDRLPPQPPGNRRSVRVRGRRHGRAAEGGGGGGGAREENQGGGAGGHWRSMELDAREEEIAEALDLFKSRSDFEAEKESIERKLRELREKEEELEMLGNYIEERRVKVRANEVEAEKKRKAAKAKEKEIKRKTDDLRYREVEYGKRLGKLIVREKRIEKLESRVRDYEQRLKRLEMERRKWPEVRLELQGMEFEIVQGFGDELREKGGGRNGRKKSKEEKQKDESSSEQKKKEKEWFDAFARGLFEKGQKNSNDGDAVDKIPESLAEEPVEKGDVNSVDGGLVEEDNGAPEDKEMECNDVIDLDSSKQKKAMDRIQTWLEEQQNQSSAGSVAELIKKKSERNDDKWAECNAVINTIVAELSGQEKEAAGPSKNCSDNHESAEKQADVVESNGVGSIAAIGSSSQEELGEMGSLENQIQDSNGEFDLQGEQLDVAVEENVGVAEKESGSAQADDVQKRLVDSVDAGLVKETSEGPKDNEMECNAVNKSASLNGETRTDRTQLMCGVKSLPNEQPKKRSVDSFAELMTNSEGNKDDGTECSSAVIKPSTTTECSAKEKEPVSAKSSSTKLHPEEKQLDAVKGKELGSTAVTRQREQLDSIVEDNLGAKERESGFAQESSVPTADSQLQVKKKRLDELKKGRMTRIDRLLQICGGVKSLVNEQQKELSVDLVAPELIKETGEGNKEPESIPTKLHSLEKQLDDMCLDANWVQDGNGEQLNVQSEKLDGVVVENPGGVKEQELVGYPDTRLVSGRQLLKRFDLKRKQEQFTSLSDYTKFCFSSLNRKEDVDSEKFLYWARSKPGKRMRKGRVNPADFLANTSNNNGEKGTTELNTNNGDKGATEPNPKEKEPELSITNSSENLHSGEKQQLESATVPSSIEGQKQNDSHLDSVDELNKSSNNYKVMEEKEPESSDKCASATKPLPEEKQQLDTEKDNANGVQQPTKTATFSKRYESQKKRDWGTFLFYYSKILKHPASSTVPLCTGADVVEYLKHMDQFGKTKVHVVSCANYGSQEKGSSCECPLKQAWGSQDSLIGRLRAACEESGVDPKSNPFGSKEVRFYLKKLKEEQDIARGTSFMKKRKRRKLPPTTTTTTTTEATTESRSVEPAASLPEAGSIDPATSLPEAGRLATAAEIDNCNAAAAVAIGSSTG